MKSFSRAGCLILAVNLLINTAGLSPAAAGIGLSATKRAPIGSVKIDPAAQAKAEAAYAALPLSFESNRGQTDASVKFLARGKGYTLFLTSSEAVLALQAPSASRAQVVRMRLKGSNAAAVARGLELLPGESNYLTGNDPRKWQTGVERYSKVQYAQVYPGIDMVYYGNQGELEYDFVVAPGADPDLIRLAFQGTKSLELDRQGNLVLNLKEGRLAFSAPILYQKTGERRDPVEGRFVLASNKQVRFEVGAYDESKELVIDPSLLYSTYLGGTVEDRANAITLDSSGNVYLTGLTVSASYPVTAGVTQGAIVGGTDAFVTKVSAAGAVVWSTFLGGGGIDIAHAIAVDGSSIVHITGATTSTNFPTSAPHQAANAGGTDAFVSSINAAGTALVYSTYFGGSGVDDGYGIAVDAAGNAYVTGDTTSNATTFPQTPGAYQTIAGGASDAFVAKFFAAGGLAYSTFLGGTAADIGRAIAIDGIGNAYVTGQAADTFPIVPLAVPTAFKTTITGPYDVFVSKLDSTGAILLYSTYVGGSDIDDGFGIALDGTNPATLTVYITGYTFSADMPKPGSGFANVGQTTIGTAPDAYVFRLNMNGGGANLDGVFFTYLGGSTDDRATGIKVDTAGNAYVTGHTTSGDFPMVQPIKGTLIGTGMVFVTEVDNTGGTNVFSTYLGGVTDQAGKGIALDSSRNIYVAGWTDSTDFDTASPIQAANAGSFDAFVTKIQAPSPLPPSNPLPSVTSVTPAGGVPTGGTVVVIGGTAFTGVTGAAAVKFGGTNAASYTVDSSTRITAISPPHAAGIVNIVVTNSVGSSPIVPEDQYTYFIAGGGANAPALTSIDPKLGPVSGGTTVVITGTAFNTVTGANGVKFGELNAESYVVNSDTRITAKTKAHAAGVVDAVVTSPSGSSPIVPAGRYTYFAGPITGTGACADPYLFPSPARGTTAHVAYCLDGTGIVNIRIYNEIGDLVEALEESKPAGAQGSSFNVGRLAPGVYFYILKLSYDAGYTTTYAKRKFVVIH
jgi:hypothetical protein